MTSYNNIRERLNLISSLEKGETISTSGTTACKIKHAGLINSFCRWYYSENRTKTIDFIQSTYELSRLFLFSLYEPLKEKEIIYEKIRLSLEGLKKLSETYDNDNEVKNKLVKLQEDLNKILDLYKKIYPLCFNNLSFFGRLGSFPKRSVSETDIININIQEN